MQTDECSPRVSGIPVEYLKECPKCGYRWLPYVKSPKKCPSCQHKL